MPVRIMRYVAGAVLALCTNELSQSFGQVAGVYAWPPGPFELHYYLHGASRFQRRPYYAENPPVYYLPGTVARSYGWTPYPYPGLDYYRSRRRLANNSAEEFACQAGQVSGQSRRAKANVFGQQRRVARWLDPQVIRRRHAMYVKGLQRAARR